jgi:ketosteroid isomerase-like protein
MQDATLVGGSEEDRAALLKLHHDYLVANTTYDQDALMSIWSALPEAAFFNLNGHTYNGREHWLRLWQFYGPNVASTYWTPYDIGGVIGADMATIWCHRRTRRQWRGATPPPRDFHYANDEFVSRSTLVFRREPEGWRVVHAHFSEATNTPRPGGV